MQSNENDCDNNQSLIKQKQDLQLPQSWKQAASTLLKNRKTTAEKQRLGKMRQFHRLKIIKLIEQLKTKKIVISDIDILNIDQIQNLIQEKQTIIEDKIAKNQKLKMSIIRIAQVVNNNKKDIWIKKKNLQQVIILKNRNRMIDDYLRFTFEQIEEIKEKINSINEVANQKINDLKKMKSQIQTFKQDYLRLCKEIQHTKESNIHLATQLIQYRQHYNFSTKKQLSNERQMIECLFQIGILIEQNYVFERVQKCLQLQQKAQVIKIQKNLSDRRLFINYQQDILKFLVLISIYMHCKSLIISNIVNTMLRLSFYSEEFKSIYDFQLFQRYCKIFIEKEKFNSDWEEMRKKVSEIDSGNQILRIVYVVLDQKMKIQVLQYMQIYENINKDFSLKISSNLRMMIKVFSYEEYAKQKSKSPKNIHEQSNVLHIKFKENLTSLGAQYQ